MTTFCINCEHKGQDSPKSEWWRWYCKKHPWEPGEQFVTPEPWLAGPPFKRCAWVNRDGVCPDWELKTETKEKD
jgi:hypothetical protein